jgi:hypothetical protein
VIDVGTSRSDVVMTTGLVPANAPGAACTNCGEGPVGRFCAACGQRHITPNDFTTRVFVRQALDELVSVDGRFWLTLWSLLRYPGQLARDYFDGRGGRYMRPLNLFLLLNLVFFAVQPHTGLLQWHLAGYMKTVPRARDRVNEVRIERAVASEQRREASGLAPRTPSVEPMEVFEADFEATIQNLKKSMLLVAIPIFALAIAATFGFRRHRLAEHLVFSTHFYAFSVFCLAVLVPACFWIAMIGLRAAHAPPTLIWQFTGELPLTLALLVFYGRYLFVGLRRMYGVGRLGAVVRAVVLFGAYQLLVILFAVRMFDLTLWAM